MASTRGRITVVQEGRFRLVTDDGRCRLFVLAHGAAQEPQDLAGLVDGEDVLVEHSAMPGTIAAALARRIERAPDR